MTRPCPRIVIAGVHSGAGKTSVTLGLVRAFRRRGLTVQTFKVGPDYLDPTYLRAASGRPCYNLDGWMAGREYVRRLFCDRTADADIAVVEGVMGLFDGRDPVADEGSTAEIAVLLDAPVLLVVDVHGMARSIAALVKGFSELEPRLRLAGVVANRCGSERHGHWLGEALKGCRLPALVAWPPRGVFPTLSSRHLGLVTATDRNVPDETLDALGDALERHADMDEIVRIASTAPALQQEPQRLEIADRKTVRLGIAFDDAFHFYYPDNLEALEGAGCELVRFSPLRNACLPDGLDAIYLGGGYPEEHAAELSANFSMLESVRGHAASGRIVYGECGGLMYLSQGIEDTAGNRHPMVALLPRWTRMLDRLKSLGYVEVTLSRDSQFGDAGTVLRGHEFHYSELVGDPAGEGEWTTVYRLQRMRSDNAAVEGYQRGNVLAGYVHLHFASRPAAVKHFVDRCRRLECPADSREEFSMSLTPEPRPLIHMLYEHPMSGSDIESGSFAIIDREAPSHGFTSEQWEVVRRMLHTSADFSLMGLIRFSAGAVDAAVEALASGAPIYVDSNMIRSGLSLARLKEVNAGYGPEKIICHVADADVADKARSNGLPRSLYAVRKAREKLHGGIAVFGNAPVALLELNRLIMEENIRPSVVIAMPVGFVHVTESKEELMSLNVPYVAVTGRRGGSPLAVSAVHALCSVTVRRRQG